MILIAQGGSPLGPTASLETVFILIVLATLLIFSTSHRSYLYLLISAVLLLGSLGTIFGAFYNDSSLWPSEVWRFTGITLNCFAVSGAIWGIINWLRFKGN